MAKYGEYRILIGIILNETNQIKKATIDYRDMIVIDWKNQERREAEVEAAIRLGFVVNEAFIALADHNIFRAKRCHVIVGPKMNPRIALRINRGGQIVKTKSIKDI
ncbi:MAG: hypothetical protein WAV51_01025 [Microgenomates group bacterium]